jgi:hypothetical protein
MGCASSPGRRPSRRAGRRRCCRSGRLSATRPRPRGVSWLLSGWSTAARGCPSHQARRCASAVNDGASAAGARVPIDGPSVPSRPLWSASGGGHPQPPATPDAGEVILTPPMSGTGIARPRPLLTHLSITEAVPATSDPSWFSLIARIAREARPARRAGPIVRPPRFRPEWADEGGPSTGPQSASRLLVAKWGGRASGAMIRPRNDRRLPPSSILAAQVLDCFQQLPSWVAREVANSWLDQRSCDAMST